VFHFPFGSSNGYDPIHHDTLEEETLSTLLGSLRGLNSRAQFECAPFAKLDVEDLLSKTRFDRRKTFEAARWNGDLLKNRDLKFSMGDPSESSVFLDYGIGSFVYNARRPFDEQKIHRYLRKGIPGLLRAKGYFWTNDQSDSVGFLSICGDIQRMDYAQTWWQVRVERGEIPENRLPASVQKVWTPELGDRRQEIVFIGIDLDQDTIKHDLDACLL